MWICIYTLARVLYLLWVDLFEVSTVDFSRLLWTGCLSIGQWPVYLGTQFLDPSHSVSSLKWTIGVLSCPLERRMSLWHVAFGTLNTKYQVL